MDWEKQDNELRSLLDNSNFLPEGEIWDGNRAWEKLQQKNGQGKRKVSSYWLQYATAACLIALLGMGIFWILKSNISSRKGAVSVKGSGINMEDSYGGPNPISHEGIQMEKESFSSTGVNSKNEEAKALVIQKEKKTDERNDDGKRDKIITPFIELSGNENTMTQAETNDLVAMPKNASSITIQNTEVESQTLVATPSPPKKLRVIHFNDLNGNRSSPPPGFVRSNKIDQDWETLVLQSPVARKEPSLQLKIDISPASKKSL